MKSRLASLGKLAASGFLCGKSADDRLEAGFQKETVFACLTQYFLRPRPATLAYINLYTSLFALPTIYSIGIHVRTGDRSMVSQNILTVLWRLLTEATAPRAILNMTN